MAGPGFQHSSFTFGQESGVARSAVAGTIIPSGSLLGLLQRALNYVQVRASGLPPPPPPSPLSFPNLRAPRRAAALQAEVNLTDDGRPAELEDLDAIDALTLLEAVQPEVCEQRRGQLRRVLRESGRGPAAAAAAGPAAADASQAMEVDMEVPADRVRVLSGHENEVFACAWNPVHDVLASGSGDATVRLWFLGEADAAAAPLVLRHMAPEGEEGRDVTTLDWNADGSLLGTGSADGAGRIWTLQGDLQNKLVGHGGPIFSLKWNRRGDLLVTSSVDHTAIVWHAATGQAQQRFAFHSAPCLDVDWRDDETFASCSTDMLCYVCRVGDAVPARTFRGHEDEVNGIKWDASGTFLASCSDDCTAKIWTMDQDAALFTLKQGDKIYSLKWSHAPPASAAQPLLLASASFDCTTKVWNARDGACLYTLRAHTLPVYSVDFSPDGLYLASGSFDNCLLIWSLKSGQLVQTHHGGGGIFEVRSAWPQAPKLLTPDAGLLEP